MGTSDPILDAAPLTLTGPVLEDAVVGVEPYPPIISPPSPELALALAVGVSGTVEVPIWRPEGPREMMVPERVRAGPPGRRVWDPMVKPDGEAVKVWDAIVKTDGCGEERGIVEEPI